MSEDTAYRVEKNNGIGKKLLGLFLLGLILGLLIGALVLGKNEADENQDGSNNASNTSSHVSTKKDEALITAQSTPTPTVLLAQYSNLLVEASREGVDTPSAEATAAKSALDAATANLVTAFNDNKTVKTDLMAINESMLEYASTARSGDEHATVDKAFDTLAKDLQQQYSVEDSSAFTAKVTSLKNTLLEGVRNFVKKDYQASYEKQMQAEKESNQVFAQLKNK